MRPIHIIITGGTIDKVYNEQSGTMVHDQSVIQSIIQRVNCSIPCTFTNLFLRDSLDITQHERTRIKQRCDFANEDSVIVVHGTDTMIKTATLLSELTDKTIITVGSFIPHSLKNSDSEFNLGAAVAYSQSLPYGSYVAMNGIAYLHTDVVKNYELQRFESR